MKIKVQGFNPESTEDKQFKNLRFAITDLTLLQLNSICEYIEFIRKTCPDSIFKEKEDKNENINNEM